VPLPSGMPALAVTAHGRVRAVFYLHGFASSPKSTKVGYFSERLRDRGIELRCPDLNQPDFSTLTLTRMLDQLGDELARLGGERAVLIGSSLGGTLAILAAAQFEPQVDRLVLLAPAVMFAKPGHHLLPPERIDEWRRRGTMPFFHYAHGTERDLNVEFYEDSLRHDAFNTEIRQPALVFQGTRDASVDYRTVEAFAKARANVTLALLDDDHQLIASLPRIWNDVEPFLGLTE
jgi:pimeloyl-ACP methyl ester carboxylesterase